MRWLYLLKRKITNPKFIFTMIWSIIGFVNVFIIIFTIKYGKFNIENIFMTFLNCIGTFFSLLNLSVIKETNF